MMTRCCRHPHSAIAGRNLQAQGPRAHVRPATMAIVRIVCMSDTHGREVEVPDGDLLIHAGDFTMHGQLLEVVAFNKWLADLPHRYRVVIAGNHEIVFQEHPALAREALRAATYL